MMGTFCGVTSATPATTTSAPIPRRGLGSTRSRREAGSPLQRSLSASASQDVGECVVGIVKDITMSTRGNEHLGRDKRIDDEKVREPKPVWRSYEDVREEIRDADIFLFRGASWYSRFIELASHGVHSHSGFALDWGTAKMLMSAVAT